MAAGRLICAAAAALALSGAAIPDAVAAEGKTPQFPFGLYDKSEAAEGTDAWRAYYDRVTAVLAENNVNTLILIPYKEVRSTLHVMDRARAANIRVIMSVGNPLNPAWDYISPRYPFYKAYKHPSVIAYKYGDEPDEDEELRRLDQAYAALRPHTRLPIITAMAGESMDFAPTQFASRAWSALRTEIRFARHYPMRRTYDLENWYREKMQMPFPDWARRMEECSPTAWWLIAQTFGKGFDKSHASYWRLPTTAELNAMAHIALAYGARGIMGYALQDHAGQFQGLVDDRLEARSARDGSRPLDAWRALGSLVRDHAGFLSRHQRAAFGLQLDGPPIVAVPRVDPETGSEYVYIVNASTEQQRSGELRVLGGRRVLGARNVFADGPTETVIASRDDGTLPWTLQPGEAQLWELHH